MLLLADHRIDLDVLHAQLAIMAEQRPVDIQEVPASLARLRGLDLEPIAQPHGGEPTDPLVPQLSASKHVLDMAGLGADPQENICEVVERPALDGVAEFGRARGRERGGTDVSILVFAGELKKKSHR